MNFSGGCLDLQAGSNGELEGGGSSEKEHHSIPVTAFDLG